MKKWKKIIVWILLLLSRMRVPASSQGTEANSLTVGESVPPPEPPMLPSQQLEPAPNHLPEEVAVNHPPEAPSHPPESMESAAMSASGPAAVTFGPKCSALSPRSQVLSSLQWDCKASTRLIDLIVLHCSATWPSVDYSLQRLAADHRARGFGDYPGYHIYIRADGTMYYCRPVSVKGCHVRGYNAHSIGICYEGGLAESDHQPMDTRTAEQMVVLHEVLTLLHEVYPRARIVGHSELAAKACPCLSPPASEEYRYICKPPSPALPPYMGKGVNSFGV